MPNPQAEKLAIVSDPSLASITGTVPIAGQPNVAKLNNSGTAHPHPQRRSKAFSGILTPQAPHPESNSANLPRSNPRIRHVPARC